MRRPNRKALQVPDCHELSPEANEIMRYADDRRRSSDEAGQERVEPRSHLPSEASAEHPAGARSDVDGDLPARCRGQVDAKRYADYLDAEAVIGDRYCGG